MVWRVAGYTTWWAPIGLYTLLAFSLFPLQPILKIKEESSFLWCLLCLDAAALLFVLHCSKEHKRSVDIEKKKRSFCLVIWALLFLCAAFFSRRWRWLNIARSSSATGGRPPAFFNGATRPARWWVSERISWHTKHKWRRYKLPLLSPPPSFFFFTSFPLKGMTPLWTHFSFSRRYKSVM